MPSRGSCESCGGHFDYQLIHNGFNDTAYAYCAECGMTAFLGWYQIPPSFEIPPHGPVPPAKDHLLLPCGCGGAFSGSASPRCPRCRRPLDAEKATKWIEANAPGAKKGWRWQRSWAGLYCIVIEGRKVDDNWKPPSNAK